MNRMKLGWKGNYLVPLNILVSLVYSLVSRSNVCAKSPALFPSVLLQTGYLVSLSGGVTCKVGIIVCVLHSVALKGGSTGKI